LRLFYSASLNDYNAANPTQTDNNSNIHRQDHFVPNALDGSGNITSWVMGVDAYLYDELNRLYQVSETPTGGSGPGFTQKFIYDRWGNRKIDLAATSTVGGGVTRLDFKVLTANNRLVAPTDTTGDETSGDLMRYDKAGNLVYDNYSPLVGQRGTMVYDAENRMTSAVNGNHQYVYDADGRRTRRLVSGQPEMWQVYGVGGELVAEYEAQMPGGVLKKEYGYRGGQMLVVYDATLTGNDQLKWVVTDHLGSTRMLVNRSGDLSGIQRRDYLPFGEELASTIGHRNAAGAGYVGGNNPRQKFGSYERDSETGLDFAQARYHSSIQGRFISVDPGPFVVADPQSWNRYPYVQNNPLKFIDPTGKTLTLLGADAEYIKEELERLTGYKLKRDAKTGVVTIDEKSKRNRKDTSKALAGKLKEIVDAPSQYADVKINTVRDQPQVYFDSFHRNQLDVADYDVAKRDAPEFAARLLGHVLEEHYAAARLHGPPSPNMSINDWLVTNAHESAVYFESKVLSDFTGKTEQKRQVITIQKDLHSETIRYIYTSVTYDVISKTTPNDGSTSKVTQVVKHIK
jgi:RHS repeat-associated protein